MGGSDNLPSKTFLFVHGFSALTDKKEKREKISSLKGIKAFSHKILPRKPLFPADTLKKMLNKF